MDSGTLEEIVSILARNGRPDLIAEIKEHVKIDEDYVPMRRGYAEPLSDTEGSATSEEDYDVCIDNEGFLSLK